MDIVKDLWPEFIEINGDRIVSEINAAFDVEVVRAHVKFHYNPKYPNKSKGPDYGVITCASLGGDLTVGTFAVDYSEPCIVYTLDDPNDLV